MTMANQRQHRADAAPSVVRRAQARRGSPDRAAPDLEERLAMQFDRQWEHHESPALRRRLGHARLPQRAALDGGDSGSRLGQCRELVAKMGDWIRQHQHCLITGPTGVGKTWLACALAQRACRDGFCVLYLLAAGLLRDLRAASSEGSLTRVIRRLTRPHLLVIDEWGAEAVKLSQYRAFLELITEHDGKGSTLIVSQLAPDDWHQLVGAPTIAGAMLDRIVLNAYHISLDRGPDGRGISCQLTVPQFRRPQT